MENNVYLANARAYNIQNENEVSTILGNFNTHFIYGVMEDILQQQSTQFINQTRTNFVSAFETNFKQMENTYPGDIGNIRQVRDDVYCQIMDIIAKRFNLQLSYDQDMDKYALAYYLFDFFISNYNIYACSFFSSFICREKDSLYEALNFEDVKRSKDVSTVYNKRMYSDEKIAVISANLNTAIGFINNKDFTMEEILETIYNPDIVALFSEYVNPTIDFYQSTFVPLINNELIYPLAATQIKLDLQRMNSNNPVFAADTNIQEEE